MLVVLVCQPRALAQAGQWAWIQGNQGTNNATPTYGTKGVASAQNQPALRYGSGTWKDSSGNLWLFGGYGEDSVYAQGYLNDVWVYNIASGNWTWLNGSNVVGPNYGQGGVYGTLGVANSTNEPGGRFAPAIWQDSSGNVWMFGGSGQDSTGTVNGNGSLNDLWLYSQTTNLWTWMGGSTTTPHFGSGQPGVYGTLGTAATGNLPGGRYGAATWTDPSGNFWLFGGSGADSKGTSGLLNDLWMFSPSTKLWTWEGGSNMANPTGVYGAQGVGSVSNIPNPRAGAFAWTDPKGNFWLFSGATAMNDLWMFSPATKQWTFMSGSATAGSAGSYGTMGVPAGSNVPPGRDYGSAWTDTAGNLWLLGGIGLGTPNDGRLVGYDGTLDDQWMYNPATNQWTWTAGSNGLNDGGNYGTQGQPSAANVPGHRRAQDFWTDTKGNFWLYGGAYLNLDQRYVTYDTVQFYSDLWKFFAPAASTTGPLASLSPFGLQFSVVSGQTSALQKITLSNPGSASLSIGGVTLTGTGASVYQQSNTCGTALAAGASCTISVAFAPLLPGSFPATLSVADGAPGSPQTIAITGNALTATSTVLTGTSSVVTKDGSDTLTVTVAGTSGSGTPTGTVTLLAGGSTVTTLTLGSAGTASYTINQPPVGSATYTAQYSGDINYAMSTSGSFTVTSINGPTASAPPWTWVSGASTPFTSFATGYATITDPAGLGVASTSNYPGIRYDGVTWADRIGNLYLFGGLDLDDMWKFNVTSGAWTFLKGSFAATSSGPVPSVFGTKGAVSPSNMPGARTYAARWLDAAGNLWLFGGTGPDANGAFGPLDDLWMYVPSSNYWTWVGGDPTSGQTGVYGTLGVASAANKPGGRNEAMTWTDQSGNLWLFGGAGYDSTSSTFLNDLWMYNTGTGQWTWQAGQSKSTLQADTYGTQGVFAAGNTPSARANGMTWVDTSGRFWLFGGTGYGASNSTSGDLNDLWVFDPSLKQWAYMGGTLTPYSAGSYGVLGTGSTNNVPPARESAATFTDASGNFWLFGGAQFTFNGSTTVEKPYNDLWMYNPTQNLWTWVAGSNAASSAGTYGTLGTGSTSNIPAARSSTLAWTDNAGNFWLLGGTTVQPYGGQTSVFNDLWKATAAATTGTPSVTLNPAGPLNFTTASGSVSATQTVTLTNSGTATLTGISFGLSNNAIGVFAGSYNCPSSLAAGASCTITIGFTPASVGSYTGSLLITDSASNSPQSITLNGTGTGTLVAATTIYPTFLTFGSTLVNTTNSGQSITIANSGTAPLTVTSASIVGTNASNFAVSSNTCGTLALGATCTIAVTFTPNSIATFNATLSIADNAGNSPQTVPLSGTGSGPTEFASIGPSFVDFANQTVNTTSGSVTVTLANLSSTALTGISPAITGAGASAFAISATTCAGSVAAGASCSLSITFTPSATATFQAKLTVTDDATNSPHVVPLSGTGVAASTTSAATLSTTSLTFPNTAIGANAPLAVTVTNSGTQALSIEGVITGYEYFKLSTGTATPANVFTQTSTCGATLAVGASCVITVTFTPAAGGPYSGTLLIADTSSSFAQSVALTGVGTGGTGVSAALEPYFGINFGTVALNTTSAPMTATLTNTGSLPLTGIMPSLSGSSTSAFIISATTCGSTLAPGATCTISVTEKITTAGQSSAVLNVTDNAADSPQNILLVASSGCATMTGTNCNPGGATVVTTSSGVALAFTPATATTATATVASTEIIGRYQGTVVYDQTFPAAYGTPTVQSGVTAANAAVAAAGGSGTVVPAPALTSTATNTSTASASVYSRDAAAPVTTSESLVTFGPGTIRASSPGILASPTTGLITECTEASLPSSTMPMCYATDAGVFQILAGQSDININSTTTYLVDTTTTTTATTTTSAVYSINGTAASTPAVTLMPAGPLSFSAAYGTTSAAQAVTILNSGTGSLSLTAISLTGGSASSFAQSNTCGTSLAANASCTVSVTFTPTGAGSFTATLSIADNATGSPQTVGLTGSAGCVNNPATPYVNCNPGGSTVITNSASQQLTFATATVTPATASAYSTEIVGKYNGAVVYDQTFAAAYGTPAVQAGVTAATAAVAAAGGSSIPAPTLTSTSTSTSTVSSSTYSIAQPSASTTVTTVTSSSSVGPGTIAGGVGGLYNSANPTAGEVSLCTEASLPSTTKPTCMTTNAGTFQINTGQTDINVNTDSNYLVNTATTTTTTTTTNAAYAISVTSTAPAVSLTPAGPLSFTAVVGAKSAAQVVTILNSGTASLTLTGISLTGTGAGSFAQTNTCGASLAANASCAVSVTFSPGATGSFAAALSIADNATGSPQSVALGGTGTAVPAPAVSLTPGSLTFTSTVGTASAVQMATLTNTGSATLNVTSLAISGAGFTDTTTCGMTLSAGASCTVAVTFTPAAATAYTGAVTVTDNATGSPHVVTLSGTGTAVLAPAVSLTPGALSFTSVVGTASAAQVATLNNTGTGPLTIGGIAIQGASGFAETTTCGGTLNAGASCSFSVTFTPTGTSGVSATLAVTDNATGSPQSVTLTGAGTVATAPVASLTPAALTFSSVSGVASAVQSVTLQNAGNATLNIASIAIGGTNAGVFADTTACGNTLAAGANCSIAVTFTPTSVASFAGMLTVTDNAGGSPQSVTLSGTGTVAPSFTLGATPTNQTVQAGSAAAYMVTVTPQNGAFTGAVSLTASGLPSGASATFSPATLTPGSSAASSTLTIQTPLSAVNSGPPLGRLGWSLGTPSLALIGFLLLPRRRLRRGLALCLLAFVALGASVALTGCGGAGFRLPSRNYNVTVTAASGSQQQTITVQLTVQ